MPKKRKEAQNKEGMSTPESSKRRIWEKTWAKAVHKIQHMRQHFLIFTKWIFVSLLVGVVAGLVGTGFYYSLSGVTDLRNTNPWMVCLLPLLGVLIVFLYRACGVKKSKGTNLVISSVRSMEKIPGKMAPLIFITTILTHLGGGSAGREGAALQLGGSLAQQLGRWMRLDKKDMRIITLCGMSAAFAALFGTPITAAVFALEVVSVGVMYYAALVPCVAASLLASEIASFFGVPGSTFSIAGAPQMSVSPLLQVVALASFCAVLSTVFCRSIRSFSSLYEKLLPNQYVRAAVGGTAVFCLVLLCGTDYLGAGLDGIGRSLAGDAKPEAFALKLLFTALTLGAGFKGGEIVPCFFTGASFGCVVAPLLGLSPSFGAAIGLTALFCGVTNCPVTSILLAFELFGMEGAPFYLLAAAISYMLSGYSGLYSGQRILYSKFHPNFINRQSK